MGPSCPSRAGSDHRPGAGRDVFPSRSGRRARVPRRHSALQTLPEAARPLFRGHRSGANSSRTCRPADGRLARGSRSMARQAPMEADRRSRDVRLSPPVRGRTASDPPSESRDQFPRALFRVRFQEGSVLHGVVPTSPICGVSCSTITSDSPATNLLDSRRRYRIRKTSVPKTTSWNPPSTTATSPDRRRTQNPNQRQDGRPLGRQWIGGQAYRDCFPHRSGSVDLRQARLLPLCTLCKRSRNSPPGTQGERLCALLRGDIAFCRYRC